MALTETKIRQLKPSTEVFCVNDGDGLYLYINISGKKTWKVRYTDSSGKRPLVKIGMHPEISLKEARTIRDNFQKNKSVEPIAKPKVLTFGDVAESWHAFRQKKYLGEIPRAGMIKTSRNSLDFDILPVLGEKTFSDVTKLDLIQLIRSIEIREAKNTIEKTCTYLKDIYKYAVLHEYCEYNLADNLRSLIAINTVKRNYPHLRDSELSDFGPRLEQAEAFPITKRALRLLAYTGVRSAEVRQAQITQFDLDKKVWRIPPENVKQLRKLALIDPNVPEYLIPLSDQAIEIVKEAEAWSAGEKYLFNSPYKPNQQMGVNVFCQLIRRMGYTNDELSPHGLRATMSTVLNDSGLFKREWIEAQLSHADENKVRGTYNHAEYVEHRSKMMQWWADYLDNKFYSDNN